VAATTMATIAMVPLVDGSGGGGDGGGGNIVILDL